MIRFFVSKCFLLFSLSCITIWTTGFAQKTGYTSKNNNKGNWSDTDTWTKSKDWMNDTPGSPTNGNSKFIDLFGYTIQGGNLLLTNGAELNIYDTLWITGDLEINADLNISPGAILVVEGSFKTKGSSLTINNGSVIVKQELILTGNGDIINNATGNNGFFVYGGKSTSGNGEFNKDKNTDNWNTIDETTMGNEFKSLYNFVNGLLPVKLINFDASTLSEKVKLNWSTATELNNDLFEVERTNNGVEYKMIDEVDGHGTVNIQTNYEYIDYYPINGVSYYRLRQVDFDGQFEYSPMVKVNILIQDATFDIFPNPIANNQVKFKINQIGEGQVKAVIFNLSGEAIITKDLVLNLDYAQEIELTLPSGSENGIYIATVYIGENTYKRKIILNS